MRTVGRALRRRRRARAAAMRPPGTQRRLPATEVGFLASSLRGRGPNG